MSCPVAAKLTAAAVLRKILLITKKLAAYGKEVLAALESKVVMKAEGVITQLLWGGRITDSGHFADSLVREADKLLLGGSR